MLDTSKQINKLKLKIKELEKQSQEYLNGWKRSKADYINFGRETEKRRQELIRFSSIELIMSLLQILDGLEKSLSQIPKGFENNAWTKGIVQIHQQFEKFLKQNNVLKIKTIGEEFNPEYHEVVGKSSISKHKNIKQGVIVQEIQSGYIMYEKVIRPSRVIIK